MQAGVHAVLDVKTITKHSLLAALITVKIMVRKERLELSRLTALEPKSSASTNSATLAGSLRLALRHSRFDNSLLYLNYSP